MANSIRPRFSRRTFFVGTGLFATGGYGPGPSRAADVEMIAPEPVRDPAEYTAYVPAACKPGQFHHYTCEFDAAWAVMKSFGIDASFDEQLEAIGIDGRVEPYYEETTDGVIIHGGDIGTMWSGDYLGNFLARCTGPAMRKVFTHFGLETARVRSRRGIQQSLDAGRLVWIKTTVDFLDWVPSTWVTPEGDSFPGVLGNDHAMIVMGYDDDVAVLRDVLGPTDTNWERPYEYEIAWRTFMRCWTAQDKDGLAVWPAEDA